ncbi:MAG: hypothetical protein MJ101_03885 [Clostridia bacterium]|nr:hypothetical protein [Clostridia bacterium]
MPKNLMEYSITDGTDDQIRSRILALLGMTKNKKTPVSCMTPASLYLFQAVLPIS